MSESQHTPGPWTVKHLDTGDCLAVVHDKRQVADCGPWGEMEQENEANATLIARAPDLLAENEHLRATNAKLLEACEAAAEWAVGYPLQGPCSDADARASAIVHKVCSEAIAAAKGER